MGHWLPVRPGAAFVVDNRPGASTERHAAGFNPKIGQEISRITSALAYVAAGPGVSLVPASLQRLNTKGVSYGRITPAPPKLPLVYVARRVDTTSPENGEAAN
jgi:DNA-binding transcriptional LysR family regulator